MIISEVLLWHVILDLLNILVVNLTPEQGVLALDDNWPVGRRVCLLQG